jgi:hypothetical protein
MVFVGLDAHQGLFVATILDPAHSHVKQFKVKGSRLRCLEVLLFARGYGAGGIALTRRQPAWGCADGGADILDTIFLP